MVTNKFTPGEKVKILHETLTGKKFYVFGTVSSVYCQMNKYIYSVVINDLNENELELISDKE